MTRVRLDHSLTVAALIGQTGLDHSLTVAALIGQPDPGENGIYCRTSPFYPSTLANIMWMMSPAKDMTSLAAALPASLPSAANMSSLLSKYISAVM